LIVAAGTVGTTLAPWGLAFIQSYAADKRLTARDLRYERIDVVSGAVLTGIIGAFVVVACAATLHATGHEHIDDARQAAMALRPLAGRLAATLFGFGLVGAALLAAAVVPPSTAYSVSEAAGQETASTTASVTRRSSTAPTSRFLVLALQSCSYRTRRWCRSCS
jgi:Mn2+/Fe2+ NRAMP family transporter